MDKIFLVYVEFTFNNEDYDLIVTPCISKEVAQAIMQEEFEWHRTHTMLQYFFNEEGKLARTEDVEFEMDDNSIYFNYPPKDTTLNIYIKEHKIVVK